MDTAGLIKQRCPVTSGNPGWGEKKIQLAPTVFTIVVLNQSLESRCIR